MGNRQRIIEAGLALFNDRGTQSVSTNHIATHLSISPGNLYYHFANREEIIRAIFPKVVEAVHDIIRIPPAGEVAPADVGKYHLAAIETLWGFRFVFRDLNELLARDPVLAESFRELQRWSVGQLQTLFERLIDQGYMRQPDPPEDLARIATNTFIVWSNWVRYLTSSRATDEVDHVDIVEGAIQSFLTLAPYLEPGVAEEVRGIFDLRASKRGRVVAKPRRKSGRRVR